MSLKQFVIVLTSVILLISCTKSTDAPSKPNVTTVNSNDFDNDGINNNDDDEDENNTIDEFRKSREQIEKERQNKLRELEEIDRELKKTTDSSIYRYKPDSTPRRQTRSTLRAAATVAPDSFHINDLLLTF